MLIRPVVACGMFRPVSKAAWVAGVVLGAAMSAVPVLAQPVQQGAQPTTLLPLDDNAKESLQGVSVNDSPEARKDIETARGMERQKDWNKAASWYQDVLEKYRTRVVAYRADKKNTITVYRGIIYQVQEALAKWPPEGIAAYRSKYEGIASGLLQGAAPDDYEILDSVFKNYFITEAGKQAGLKLIDLHLEEGDFAAAAWIGDRLLDWYPAAQLEVERPRLLYRTALAYHLHGDNKRAIERAEELKRKYAATTGSIFGKDAVLSDALVGQLAAKPPRGVELAADSYPMFCGSPDRAHVSAAKGRMGAKIFSIDLPTRPSRSVPQQQGQIDLRKIAEREDSTGMALGVMPAVDGDDLFFQDGSRIYAVSLGSGVPLPGWANTYGGDRRGRYVLKGAPAPRTQQQTITVTENSVLAVMGQSNRAAFVLQQENVAANNERGTRLVCLERDSGKERWKVNPAAITDEKLKEEDRERVRSLDFSGSPLVVGDSVYVIGRGGKDPQFENCYVLAFDLATGKYKWSSLVASANSSFNAYDDSAPPSNTLSHLAYSSGRVFVLTNLGAAAAIDAYSGSVVWLTIYPRAVDGQAAGGMNFRRGMVQNVANQQQLKPWEFNPVLVQNGKLFVMPLDSKHLLVYDAGTGSELKSVDLEDFNHTDGFERPTTMLAVLGDKIVLGGRHQVVSLNWEMFDAGKSVLENLKQFNGWATTFRIPNGPPDPIRGRAFVTGDSIFVPTNVQLVRLTFRRDGYVEEVYPVSGHWDTDTQGPGNVLVTSEHVVLAAANRVDVYTDMKLALAKLDREVAAAPAAPEPRLKYAEVMFAAGQIDLALAKMKDGIDLVGGASGMRTGPVRQRVFADCLAFAQKLARDKRGESNDRAVQFYDMAAAAADTASEQVNYRISRAQFLQGVTDFTHAVRLYQEILGRPELRVVATVGTDDSGSSTNMVQASFFAESAINKVLAAHPNAYKPVLDDALAARDAARATADPDKLLEVAKTYPNATTVAPAAMLEAAELYEAAKSPRLATHVLRQIYRKYGASDDRAAGKPATNLADRAKIVEALVRNYLTLPGGYDVATARLQQAIAKPLELGGARLTKPLVTPDGKKIENATFTEALESLKNGRPRAVAERLPDFHIPPYRRLTEAEQDAGKRLPDPFLDDKQDTQPLVITGVAALLLPPAELSKFGRVDRLVTAGADNSLVVYAAGNAAPLHTIKDMTDMPRSIAWVESAPGGKTANLLAWSGKEVLLARGDTGAKLWRVDLEKLRPIEVVATAGPQEGGEELVADANAGDQPQQVFVNGRRGAVVLRNGRRVFVNGGMVQVQPVENVAVAQVDGPEQASFVQPLGDRVIVATSTGRLLCLGSADGKVLWQTRLSTRPYEKLVACEDFTVVRFTENNTAFLLAVDNHDGQVQMKKSYTLDGGNVPVNLVVSPDGMLVWTMADRICGKDLYEAGNTPKFEYPAQQAGNNNQASPQFIGCSRPGQLLIEGDKILAVEQGGRYISIRDLQTGALSRHADKDRQVESMLGTGYETPTQQGAPAEVPVWMKVAGNYVYAVGPRSLAGYSLTRPADDHWNDIIEKSTQPNFRDAFVSHDFLLLLDEPGVPRRGENPNSPLYRLRVFSRSKTGEAKHESGLQLEWRTIVDANGITQWQASDGGVYVLSGDHKLRLIKGALQ